MKKIDIFNHIWPRTYYEKLKSAMGPMVDITRRSEAIPMMTDLNERFRVMDMFEDYYQVLSLASPPLELVHDSKASCELARIGNDGMKELCEKHPDRFPGFIASLAMNDPVAAVTETDRAINGLGALGIQIYTNVSGKPLDAPEFRPVFEMMARLNKPVWLHPARGANFPDYLSEARSMYEIWWTFGWPYETSAALARLVFSKIMQDYPDLRIISHHAGGMVSFFEGRVGPGWDQLGARTSAEDYSLLLNELDQRPVDYFRKFYADTATFGSRAALVCAIEFFGIDNILFASDAPFDPEKGPMYIRETIRAIDSLDINSSDREKIYSGNAIRLTGIELN